MNKFCSLVFFIGLILAPTIGSTGENSPAETGKKAPSCMINSLSSSPGTINLQDYSGKVILIDFWASWCVPCRKSFPLLNQLDKRYRNAGLQIIGIGVDENSSDAERFIEKFPVTFTLGLDTKGNCPKAYSVKGMPSSYLIDRNGMMREIFIGFRENEIQSIEKSINELIKESYTLTAKNNLRNK